MGSVWRKQNLPAANLQVSLDSFHLSTNKVQKLALTVSVASQGNLMGIQNLQRAVSRTIQYKRKYFGALGPLFNFGLWMVKDNDLDDI